MVAYHFPAVMSFRAADAYLGVRHGTVAGAARRGEIKVVCFPGRKQRRVTREALDEWVRGIAYKEGSPLDAGRLGTTHGREDAYAPSKGV